MTSDEACEAGLDDVKMIGDDVKVIGNTGDCGVRRDDATVMRARGRGSWRSSNTGWRGWCAGWCTPGHGTPGGRPGG